MARKIIYFVIISLLTITNKSVAQQRMTLNWDLFIHDKPTNAEHDAVLSCGIAFSYRMRPDKVNLMEIKFAVKGGIDTAKSYFNFDLKNKDYKLLNHEQGHADIAVIYALKLKTIFNQKKFYKSNYRSVIKQFYEY